MKNFKENLNSYLLPFASRFLVVFLFVIIASSFFVPKTSFAWYNASWQNRIKITFSGATTTENLSGYPVTVLLNSSRITYANASSSGSDNLRFVDPNDNTLLPYEVGYWNPSGTSTIFVKTNHVSSTQTDFIYMYYNNPSATSTASSTAVWDSNYMGVYHMSDAGSGVVKDSTANLNNGTEGGTLATSSIWGNAEYFNGSASTSFAKFPDNVTSSFSALVWVNTTLAARAAAIMGNEDWDADRNGFEIFMGGVTGSFGNELTTASAQYISANIASNSNNGLWQSLETTWQYGATSNVNFYINGINYYDPTVNGVVPVLNAYKVKLGANPGSPTPYWFNGAITEVRLSKVMRSPGWAVADWRNGMDTYNTYAAPESNGTAPIISSFTASPSSITSGVTSSLSWTITGATSASIDQGIGSVATSTGSTSVSPIITTTYTLTANNANGTITATTTVTVATSTWWNTNWQNREKITFSGATTTGNLSNFPVLVNLNSSRINYSNTSPSSLTSGLVGWWKMDEGSGATSTDSSGNNNNGTINGATWATGKMGQALSFVRSNGNQISVSDSPNLQISGSWTASAWFKMNSDTPNYGVIVAKNGIGTNYMLDIHSGRLLCGYYDNGVVVGPDVCSSALNLNQWYLGTVVWDSAAQMAYIYLNGQLVNSEHNTTSTPDSRAGNILSIGSDPASGYFDGSIDDVRVYNRALSQTEISQLASPAGDLRFIDPNGSTQLPYEVENWNPSGTSTVWVKANHVSSSQSDYMYMYYNNPSATSTASSTQVWDSNFMSVWHLTTSTDAKGNYNGLNNGATATSSGQFGGAMNFNNTAYISASVPLPSTATFSFWATWDGTYSVMPFLAGPYNSGPDVYFYNGKISWNTWNSDGNPLCNTPGSASDGKFHYYGLNVQSGNTKLYYDGQLCGSASYVSPSGSTLIIGGTAGSPPYGWIRSIDEFRLSSTTRSVAWLEAEYKNGMDTYNTYGAAESAPTISSFTANPTSTTSGSGSTLSWSVSGSPTPTLSIDQGVGTVTGTSTIVSPTSTTIYTLTASNANGTATASTTVTVTNPSAWWNTNWQNREKITFSGATTTENLANFPVLVSLNSSRITYANASSSGSTNIRFIDPDNSTQLPYEVENWNPSGTSTVWVKANHVSSSQSDYMYMYYNNPSATSTASSTQVWDSNFKAVWHFSTNASTSDTTSNGNTLIPQNSPTSTSGGLIDGAMSFSAASSTWLNNGNQIFTTSTQTFCTWVKPAALGAYQSYVLDGQYPAYFGMESNSGNNIYAFLSNDGYSSFGTSLEIMTPNVWHYVCALRSSNNTATFYIDGAQSGAASQSVGTITAPTGFQIGTQNGGGAFLNGLLDELRVSNTGRSAQWIEAEYKTGVDTYNTYGASESTTTPSAPTISSFIATPSSITLGSSTVLSWSVSGATSASIDNGVGSVSIGTASTTVSPTQTTTYTLTATSTSGTTTSTVTVTVSAAASGNWWNTSYANRMKITFTGATTTESEANFPVLVSLNSSRITYASTTPTSTNPFSNIVGYWKMDEGSGTTSTDSSGNGYTLSLNGSSWTTGVLGKGLSLNGSTNYLSATKPSAITSSTPWTVSMWAKYDKAWDTSTLVGMWHMGDASGQYGICYWYNYTGFSLTGLLCRAGSNTSNTTAPAIDIKDNNWHHWVFTWDGNSSHRMKIYKDGVDVTGGQPSSLSNWNNNAFEIGNGLNESYNSQMSADDARVYNRVLSQSEISQLANLNGAIRFIDPDGSTQLPYEIEKWDTTATSTIWVKANHVSSTQSDYMYMYYNNPNATSTSGTSTVWNSNFKGVYHLATNASTTDSTSNAYNLTSTAYPTPSSTGQIDGGQIFNGSTNFLKNTSLSISPDSSSLTISTWVKMNSWALYGAGVNQRIIMENVDNNNVWMLGAGNSAGTVLNTFFVAMNKNNVNYEYSVNNTFATSTWYHVVVTWAIGGSITAKMYVNGVQQSLNSETGYSFGTADNAMWLGARSDSNGYFNGTMDDTRISNSARSAGWVWDEYYAGTDSMNTYAATENMTTASININQQDYRWYQNGDVITPTSSLASQDTAISISSTSTPVRLRMNILNSGSALAAQSQAFKLQYGTSTSGAWTDVGSGASSWWNNSWQNRRKITFTGATTTGSLSNFPILVNLNSSRINYASTSPSSLTSGLQGWWKMDEGSGTQANDSSGNNNTGTIGGATWTTGKMGGALDFTRSNANSITVSDSTNLQISGSWTASAWFKMNSDTPDYGVIVAKNGVGANYTLKNSPGRLVCNYFDNGVDLGPSTCSSAINLNQWYLGTAVWDASAQVAYLYLNGQLVNSQHITTTTPDSRPGNYLTIGSDAYTSGYFDGSIDDVRIYNRALSQTEIQQLANPAGDLRFIDPDNSTQLNYEVENWNPSGTSTIWVKANHVSSTQNDYMYMYYGNTSATSTASSTQVWDSNFKAVWHLGENATSTGAYILDSTSNNNNGTVSSTNLSKYPTPTSTGFIDGAQTFLGEPNPPAFDFGNPSSLQITRSLSVSAWVSATNINSNDTDDGIVDKANSGTPVAFHFKGSQDCTGTNYQDNLVFSISSDGGFTNFNQRCGTTVLSTNTRYFVEGVFNGAAQTMDVYVNGKLENGALSNGTTVPSSIYNSPSTIEIGNNGADSHASWNGTIDEVRISSSTRSSQWIEAEYKNGVDTYDTYGSEESKSANSVWNFYDNPSLSSAQTVTSTVLSTSNVGELYNEYNSGTTNPNAISANQYGEYDYALDLSNIAAAATTTNYYFRMANTDGSTLTSYANYPSFAINAAAQPVYSLSQIKYQWFNNAASTTPGAAKAALNNHVTWLANGDVLRLRVNLKVSNTSLPAGTILKLQYSRDAAMNQWTDLGATGDIIGYHNSGLSDGLALPALSSLISSDVMETYQESGTTAGMPNVIPQDQSGEWDWAIQVNTSREGATYFFRVARSDGKPLNSYVYYPTIGTKMAISPGGGGYDIAPDTSSTGGGGGGGGLGNASGTPTFVQENEDIVFSGSSVGTTLNNIGAGNALAVGVYWFGAVTLNSVIDNCSEPQAYTLLNNPTDDGSGDHGAITYNYNVKGGNCTITANFSGAVGEAKIWVHEVSGVLTTDPIDGHNATVGGSRNDICTDCINSGAISAAGSDYIFGFTYDSASADVNNGTNFTKRSSGSSRGATEDLIQGQTGSVSATFSRTDTRWALNVTFIMALKAGSPTQGGGGPPGGDFNPP